MCGKCCDPVLTDISPERISDEIHYLDHPEETAEKNWVQLSDKDAYTFRFIHEHWKHVTKEEVLDKNPVIAHTKQQLYLCDQYNTETRECMAQDSKPDICSGYPWYGKTPVLNRLYVDECSYHADVEQFKEVLKLGLAPSDAAEDKPYII